MMMPHTESVPALALCAAVALLATFAWYLINWLAFDAPLN